MVQSQTTGVRGHGHCVGGSANISVVGRVSPTTSGSSNAAVKLENARFPAILIFLHALAALKSR